MASFKVLLLDNTRETDSFGSASLVRELKRSVSSSETKKPFEVHVRRSPDQDLPRDPKNYQAIVLSGSITSCTTRDEAWIPAYDEWVWNAWQKGFPIFGVCYGHQTLSRISFLNQGLSSDMGRAQHPEHGWVKLTKVMDHPWLNHVPDSFYSFQAHYEEVKSIPPGAARAFESDQCMNQGFIWNSSNLVVSTQFHPEYNAIEGDRSVQKKIEKKDPQEWIFHPDQGKKYYDESISEKLFGNFFRIAGYSNKS